MKLSEVQRGVIGQTEAAKIIMVTTNGEVECDYPATDDEHRDVETHRRGHFVAAALQIKTAWRLWTHRRSQIIQIPFSVRAGRLVSDARFYYLFGFFDQATMTFRDPLFLVPSTEVHKHAMPRLVGGRWHFMFQASLKPGAKDRWSPYRVTAAELGKVLLKVIRRLEKEEAAARSGNKSLPRLGKAGAISLPVWGRGREGVLRLSARRRPTTISKAA